MKPEYKLVIVERDIKKGVVLSEREIVTIGYFKAERQLQQWTEDNLGEIEKE